MNLRPAPNSPRYFLTFWEDVFECSLTSKKSTNTNVIRKHKCNGREKLSIGKGYYPLTPVHSVINAVHAIADVIKNMLGDVCSEKKMKRMNKTECIIDTEKDTDRMNKYLVKRVPKYEDGTVKYTASPKEQNVVRYDIHRYSKNKNILVGKWAIQREDDAKVTRRQKQPIFQMWYLSENGSRAKMHAFCSQQCPIGHVRVRDTNTAKEKCCWTCRKCPANNIVSNDTCIQCKETEKTDAQYATCSPLPRKFINLSRTLSWVFCMLSVIGLFTVFFVIVLFIRLNDNHIVRSSGRDLCYLILFGICLTFLCPFMFLTKPSTQSCLFRGALPGLAFICCYAPLFLRTNRIYRIFFHAKTSVVRPSLVSTQSQLIVSCGIVAIQFLLVVVWFVSKMPSPVETVAPSNQYVNIHCKASPIILLLNLALSVIFMVLCTVLAFKTRHFPKNYNEAKHIGITLYLSCVAWAVFFPGYFLTNPKTEFLREYLMCAICVAIGYITLFGLFGRKVGMLLFGVPKGIDGNNQTSWNLSENHTSERHFQLTNSLKSVPTQDMLL